MKKINNILFYNERKLADAQRIGGDDMEVVLAHYVKNAGHYEEVPEVASKPVKKTTRAKKAKK